MITLTEIVCDKPTCEAALARPRHTDTSGTVTYLGAHGWGVVPGKYVLCVTHRPTTARRAAA